MFRWAFKLYNMDNRRIDVCFELNKRYLGIRVARFKFTHTALADVFIFRVAVVYGIFNATQIYIHRFGAVETDISHTVQIYLGVLCNEFFCVNICYRMRFDSFEGRYIKGSRCDALLL